MTTIAEEYERRCVEKSDIADHLPRLYAEAVRYPGVRVLELGVRSGNSTAAFLWAAERVDGHVTSVDLQAPTVPTFWHDSPRWSLWVGDDLDLADVLPECDVLFVDTSHTYEQTTAELRAFWPKVRPGGVALLHDTELEAPEGDGFQPPFPVRLAIDEFCAANDLTPEYVAGCYGLGIIRKVA